MVENNSRHEKKFMNNMEIQKKLEKTLIS